MLTLTEDQKVLAESARDVLDAEAPRGRFRELRDGGVTHDAGLWSKLVELGWPAIPFPEERGGLGWGLAEVAVVAEELGRRLAKAPLLSLLTAGLLDPESGAQEGRVVALAWRESDRGRDTDCSAAVVDGRLSGAKRHVLDGACADGFVVTAQVQGQLGLFRVSREHADVTPLSRVDGRDCAHVSFDGAPAERLPGGVVELEAALDAATVALAAEMLGAAEGALAMTLDYLRERVQFDAPIGSFQALQHRAVDVFVAVQLARSAVMAAARAPQDAELVSLAKVKAGEALLRATREAVQMHGGIGVTDEHDIGFFLKWGMGSVALLGDEAWHRDRWARLRGY